MMDGKIIKKMDSKLLKPYENKWVALSNNKKKVVASGKTLSEVFNKIKRGKNEYMFTKVLPFEMNYAPFL